MAAFGLWLFLPLAALGDPALLAEGQLIAKSYGNQVWPGFSRTAFPVLVIGANKDTLYCAPTRPEGFDRGSVDLLLQCRTDTRTTGQYPASMKATFPMAGLGPVVVMGAPDISGENPASWIATLLHEHFHQYQMNWPGYFEHLNQLDLAGDDTSGMWALNYPFPYQDPKTNQAMTLLASQLIKILDEPDPEQARQKALAYARLRGPVLDSLPAADRRYLEFQLWQEGVARYTELAMTEFAASGTESGLAAHHNYAGLAANLRARILSTLAKETLADHGRVYLYSFGAAEALVLDQINSNWRTQYFDGALSMAGFFERGALTD